MASTAMWEKKRADGTAGWTPERRARQMLRAAERRRDGGEPGLAGRVFALEATVEDLVMSRTLTDLRQRVADLEVALAKLEVRPGRVVEWRPDHRRIKDGGTHATAQRHAMGLPKRLPRE